MSTGSIDDLVDAQIPEEIVFENDRSNTGEILRGAVFGIPSAATFFTPLFNMSITFGFMFGAFMGMGLPSLKGMVRKRRRATKLRSLPLRFRYDVLFERPALGAYLGAAAGAGFGLGGVIGGLDDIVGAARPLIRTAAFAAFGYLSSYLTLGLGGFIAHHSVLKNRWRRYQGRPEQPEERLPELVSPQGRAAAFLQMAEREAARLPYSSRVPDKLYTEIFHVLATSDRFSSFADDDYPSALSLARKIDGTRIAGKPRPAIGNAAIELLNGNAREADDILHGLIYADRDEKTPEPHLAHARLMQILAEHDPEHADQYYEIARSDFRNYAQIFLQTTDTKWELVGDSRNEVMRADNLAIILKRSKDKKRIDQERRVTRFWSSYFGPAVTNLVSTFKDGPHYYLVMEVAGQEILDSSIQKGAFTPEDIYEPASMLGSFHAFGLFFEKELEATRPAEKRGYFEQRLRDVTFRQLREHGIDIPSELEQAVIDSYLHNSAVLSQSAIAAYVDANARNYARLPGYVKIDSEEARLLPYGLDLVNLLEFSRDYLTPAQKEKAIEHYKHGFRHTYEHFSAETGLAPASILDLSPHDFERFAEFAAVHRHLELLGYRARDADTSNEERAHQNSAAQRFHFEKALEHLETIEKKFAGEQVPDVRRLYDALSALDPYFTERPQESQARRYLEDFLHSAKGKAIAAVGLAAIFASTLTWSMHSHTNYLFFGLPVVDKVDNEHTIYIPYEDFTNLKPTTKTGPQGEGLRWIDELFK